MQIGDQITTTDCVWGGEYGMNGVSRTGKIVYIHPRGIFATVRFDKGYPESFPLKQISVKHRAADPVYKHLVRPEPYKPEEITRIINASPESDKELAKELGRSRAALRNVRCKYRKRMEA